MYPTTGHYDTMSLMSNDSSCCVKTEKEAGVVVGIFFKEESKRDAVLWRKSCIFAFYILLTLLLIDSMAYNLKDISLFTSQVLLWVGILSAFLCQFVLKMKSNKKRKKRENLNAR